MKTLRAGGELVALAWRMDRVRLVKAALLMCGASLATPLIAVGLRELTNALLRGHRGVAVVAGLALAVLLMLELMGQHFAHLSYFELGELSQAHLQQRLMTAANSGVPLARREQPDYADDVQVAESQIWSINRALEATLQFGGLVLQLALSTVLLGRLNPVLLLVPCLAVFLIIGSGRAQRETNRAQERAAEHTRLSDHFLRLATTPESLLELRLLGLRDQVVQRHARAWTAATGALWRGHARAALVKSTGQLAFAAGYAIALLFVFRQLAAGRADVGDFVLVLALAVQTTVQTTTAATLLAVLQQAAVSLARIHRLADPPPRPAASRPRRPAATDPPPRPTVTDPRSRTAEAGPPPRGIVLRGVCFAYPASSRPVLEDVNLDLAPGAVVAVVGENGAGKSTLIKLLCGLYRPTAGRIWLDGREVTGDGPRIAALFQDFARVELTLRDSVGVGGFDGVRIAPDQAVLRALDGADIGYLLDSLPEGLDGLLGRRYGRGAELSGGQWQRVALARALVRDRPALLTLDEPAAALDPLAEHALFERFAAAARAQDARGAVTVYVSHRFSTVRMADLIVVLRDGRVAARGTHDELMRAGGTYAELFTLQARAYTTS